MNNFQNISNISKEKKWYFYYEPRLNVNLGDLTGDLGIYKISKLVKESLQNVVDAKNTDAPAEIFYDLIEVPKSKWSEIIRIFNIDINDLKENLILMEKKDPDNEGPRYGQTMRELLENESSMFILRMIDIKTSGLTKKPINNFDNFFFQIGRSDKNAIKRGSYGKGRFAILIASELQTVLVATHLTVNGYNENVPYLKYGMAMFGPFTKQNNGIESNYHGAAYYGFNPDHDNVPVPLTFENYPEEDPFFPSELQRNTGTAFHFPFFNITEEIKANSIVESKYNFFHKLRDEVQIWFFAGIYEEDLKINIRFLDFEQFYHKKSLKKKNNEENSEWKVPLIYTIDKLKLDDAFKLIFEHKNVIIKEFFINIPPRKELQDDKYRKIKAKLYLLELDKNKPEFDFFFKHDLQNKVILGRSNMVIEYNRDLVNNILIDDNKNFLVYFMTKNEYAARFFRSSEPARHNRWNKSSQRLKSQYKGGSDALQAFKDQITEIVEEIFGYKSEDESKDHQVLINDLFSFLPRTPKMSKSRSQKKIKDQKVQEIKNIPAVVVSPPPPPPPHSLKDFAFTSKKYSIFENNERTLVFQAKIDSIINIDDKITFTIHPNNFIKIISESELIVKRNHNKNHFIGKIKLKAELKGLNQRAKILAVCKTKRATAELNIIAKPLIEPKDQPKKGPIISSEDLGKIIPQYPLEVTITAKENNSIELIVDKKLDTPLDINTVVFKAEALLFEIKENLPVFYHEKLVKYNTLSNIDIATFPIELKIKYNRIPPNFYKDIDIGFFAYAIKYEIKG